MTAGLAFLRRHPAAGYFALTFAISWGGLFWISGGPAAIPGTDEQVARLLPLAMLMWFAGPSLAGILLTGLLAGRYGLRLLVARFALWRVPGRWYAVALLTAPLLYLATTLLLALFSPAFLPALFTAADPRSLLLFGFTWGLIGGGLLEELGWSGFATPYLRRRTGPLTTALVVGIAWGALHAPLVLWMGGSTFGAVPPALFIPVRVGDLLAGGLVAYRVLMVWIYERTQGSMLLALLAHTMLSTCMLVLGPVGLAGWPFLVYCLGMSILTWVAVAAAGLAARGQFTHPHTPPAGLDMRGLAPR